MNIDKLLAFQESTALSKEHFLPLVPSANNPWIYMAYAFLCCEIDEEGMPLGTGAAYRSYRDKCAVKPGVFDRFPGAVGGSTSHDEIMGRAFLEPTFADEVLEYLSKTDWNYNSLKDREPNVLSQLVEFEPRDYLGRFIFLDGFLRACSTKYKCGLLAQAKWIAHVLGSAFTSNPASDASGVLKIWLMGQKMKKYTPCELAFHFWKARLTSKYQVNPKVIFSNYYLKEEPVFAQTAPESF